MTFFKYQMIKFLMGPIENLVNLYLPKFEIDLTIIISNNKTNLNDLRDDLLKQVFKRKLFQFKYKTLTLNIRGKYTRVSKIIFRATNNKIELNKYFYSFK